MLAQVHIDGDKTFFNGAANMTETEMGTTPRHKPFRRKILIDSHLYCPYSMRQSEGDVHCDHDFDEEPSVTEATCAIWNCTICGRAVRFDTWN
jgi:hypothetical protein